VTRPRIVVIGDAMLDRDLEGRTERIAPDAPVPVFDVQEIRDSPGGAGLTALLCAAADVEVLLIAPIADDQAGARLSEQLGSRIEVLALAHRGGTRVKTRVRSGGQCLLRVDEGGPGVPIDPPLDLIRAALASADVVLVSDYGGGTTSDPGIREMLTEFAVHGPVVWDPHPRGGGPVPGVTLVTPNLAEALDASAGVGTPDALATGLRRQWRARSVCVTVGPNGAYLALSGSEAMFVPAPAVSEGDPCGAGDRFTASAAICLAHGAVLSEAVVQAVAEASAWVGAGGAAAFRARERERADPGAEPSRAEGTVEELIAAVRARRGQVVATGGCFDILHVGHIACLEAARKAGDALIVLLNSDDSVRRLKGPERPAVPAPERARVLRALQSVDAVVVFEEDDPRAALERLRPDVWAKGGDYGGAELPEAELVRSWGGRVLLLPYLDGRSTTAILEQSRSPLAFTPKQLDPNQEVS
jgi:D-beta-D-heptose 7-phosphate kinase/D-beta-D-heptose 1-phosphate adenosyltransferase